MRINIYEEEMTEEVTLIVKAVKQEADEVVTFYGIRFWLESPPAIIEHSTPDDDDRSAVTFWVRESGLDLLDDIMKRGYVISHHQLEKALISNLEQT